MEKTNLVPDCSKLGINPVTGYKVSKYTSEESKRRQKEWKLNRKRKELEDLDT